MTLRDVFRNGPARTVLVLWLASSAFVLFLLKWIESTLIYGVFETDFGLQWNAGWGGIYTLYMYMIYSFIAVPMALSAAVLVFGFLDERKHAQLQEHKSNGATPKIQGNMLVSPALVCPNCKKVVSQPLVTLDFNGESSKLVNLCPYCNSTLTAENAKQNEDTNIGVTPPEQKETTTPPAP